MNIADIHAALNASVVVLTEQVLPGEPPAVRWPNRAFVPPSGKPYVTVDKLPVGVGVHTMGATGEDKHRGILQLGLYGRTNEGEGPLISEFLDPISRYYTAGAFIRYHGATVQVESVTTSPGIVQDGRWVVFVSVEWTSRVTRDLPHSQLFLSSLDFLVP